jgi:hypothetical protein
MNRRWRFFWLVPLALLLVGGVERLSSRTAELGEQAADASSPSRAADSPASPKARNSRKSARLVPLYPAGSLVVAKPRPKPARAKVRERKETKRTAGKPAPAKPGSLPSPEVEGKRPALEVDYRDIGFDRYLDVIERVGRFFVLIETGDGAGLGPEVSLRAGAIVRTGGHDMDVLASARPHLVSDPGIRKRLAVIGLPAGAHGDRLVLMLTKPFDSLLWDTIRKSLSKEGLALNDIAQVKGAYEEGRNGVFLRLGSAVARTGGREYPLHEKLRVSL